MSTELRTVPGTTISQTRFWGGAERKQCVQVTQKTTRFKNEVDVMFDCVQLTRNEAKALAVELMLFAEGCEVTEEGF